MRQRITALLLALAVLASVCAVSALAEERPAPAETAQAESPEGEDRPASPETPAEAAPEAAPETAPETEAGAPSLAGPDLAENVTIQPDPLGEVSFANVERRMREGNLQLLALEQSVLTIEDIDYDKLYDQLWHQLNELAQAQWAYVRAGSMMRTISNLPTGQRPPGMEDVEYSDYEYNTTFDQLDRKSVV